MLNTGASQPKLNSHASAKAAKSFKSLRSAKSKRSVKSVRLAKSGRSVISTASRGRQSVESVLDSFRLSRRNSTLLEDEIEDALDPNAVEIQIWQQVLLACLLFEVFLITFLLTFRGKSKMALPTEYFALFACEFMFLLDFYVQAHAGYYEDGNVIRDKRKTRQRYFKSYGFMLDLIAIVPLSTIPVTVSMNRITLEVHKLTRCWRLGKYVSNLDDFYARHFVKLKLLKVMVTTMIVAHFVACVRFCFGYDEHHTNRWLPAAPHTELTVRSKYLMSLFWSFGLLSGLFEGELPHAIPEFIFTIIVALCGFSLFTSLLATFFMVSKCESGQTEAFEARINQLKHLLRFHRVPDNLQQQAIGYLKRYYTDAEFNAREATKLLCPSIVKDIQVELLKDTVAQIPLFAGCNDQFVTALTGLLEMFSVPAQFTLCQVGDFGDAMYIVHSGVLNVVINGIKVREMRKGVCFGELSVFSTSPRTATVVSATYAVLYKLSRFHSERVLEGYPACAGVISKRVLHLLQNAKKKSVVTAHSSVPSDASDLHQARSTRSSRHSLSSSVALIRRNIGSANWLGKKANQVFPAHEHAIAELISPRDETGESPRSIVAKVSEEQTLNYYSRHAKNQQSKQQWHEWQNLLLKTCIDADSKLRMWWIFALMLNQIYNWLIVPLQLSFPMMNRTVPTIVAFNSIADIVLAVDMYLNFNLSFTLDSEKIIDPVRSAERYFRKGFAFDLLCALPYSAATSSVRTYGILRSPRLLRIFRLSGHLEEIDRYIRLGSKQRLMLFGLLLIMLYHIIACLHFSTTHLEGFSHEEDAWIPSQDIYLRQINDSYFEGLNSVVYSVSSAEFRSVAKMQYFRSLYYATNVLAALGKTIEPDSDVQYSIAIVFMLSGFMITAIVVDNVQKRFTASAYEQKEFFATRTRIQLFLRRQNASLAIHHRVNSFLNFWWSSHRGAMIGELLADLPPSIRDNILRSICNPVLQTLALVAGVRTVLDKLEDVMVENVKFVLYGQGEIVYRQGDYAIGVFFLLEGEVCVITEGSSPRGVPLGGFFGTASLMQSESSDGYGEHVSATSSCILLFMASEHLRAMEAIFPQLPTELLALEKRLLGNKLAKTDVGGGAANSRRQTMSAQQSSSQQNRGLARWLCGTTALDPDSVRVLAWESWLFLVMTVQWITVLFQICFRMVKSTHASADTVTSSLEVWFLVDVYVRSRLGYYEYGNKVMDLKQIRRNYFRSRTFALDLLALIPLFMINWFRGPTQRLDVVNMNKLLRLFKVPQQFRALENRFLKLTMELRLLRLLYYTFMLSHIFGCIWFDFASNASQLGLSSQDGSHEGGGGGNAPRFGTYEWLPSETLYHSNLVTQYSGSLFWAFGLMSASNTGELPKTTAQCIFSVITMTSGFFLFAYVVGNFTDIIELMDAENKDFNAKMSSVRHVLSHFKLPPSLEDRLKTFFFFKHFHSITQEHILEHCLPPSLLTDIRLVHLKPMIAKVAFLSGMEGSVTRMLVSQFSQSVVLRGQYVCRYSEEGSDMFFVFTGVLDVLIPIDLVPGDEDDENENGNVNGDFDQPTGSSEFSATNTSPPFLKGWKRKRSPKLQTLKKINEISAGSYFGENGLFTKSLRNAHVRAQTSCILYKLSRESLELVFERYPAWKQKVIRIANLQSEQQRLNRLSQEEQSRHTTDENGGAMLSKIDVLNQRAEKMEEEMQLVRIKRSDSVRGIVVRPSSSLLLRIWDRCLRRQIPELVRQLRDGAEAQSALHLFWLRLMVICTVYIAVVVPYRIAMDPLERDTPLANLVKGGELFCELLFIFDIWFSMRVQQCLHSMELYEQAHSVTYKKERMLWDVVAALPVYHVVLEFSRTPWLRLLHCVKVVNITSYLGELNRRSVEYEFNRFRGVWLLYMLSIYWSACAYLTIAIYSGYGDEWSAWLPSNDLEIADPANPQAQQLVLRLFRGLFYATTAFVKKGRTFVPDSATHYIFSICCSFVGLLVMSFMIGEIASLFISYIGIEVDFRRNHIAVELYLARLNVSSALKNRAHAFMFSLWSSHSGVNYEAIFQEISPPIRVACALHISQQPLDWFTRTVFRSLSWDGSRELELLTNSIAQELKFEEYPRDEFVVAEGNISKAMYFVIKGYLNLQSKTHTALLLPVGLRAGDFFGERGLLGCAVSTFSVRSIRACDLLSLSSESLLKVISNHALSRVALLVAQRSYQKLKGEVTTCCSSSAMEVHWGNALVSVLHALSEKAADTPKHSVVSVSRNSPLGPNGPVVAEHSHEFQKRVRAMARALETPKECYKAFHGFLQIIAPNDPLDWTASFARNVKLAIAPTDSERHASFTQAKIVETQEQMDESLPTTTADGKQEGSTETEQVSEAPSVPPVSTAAAGGGDFEPMVVAGGSLVCQPSLVKSEGVAATDATVVADGAAHSETGCVGPSIDLIPGPRFDDTGAADEGEAGGADDADADRQTADQRDIGSGDTSASKKALLQLVHARETLVHVFPPEVAGRGATTASPRQLQRQHETDSSVAIGPSVMHLNELRALPPKYVRFQHPAPPVEPSTELEDGGEPTK